MNNERYATSVNKGSCYMTGEQFLQGPTVPPVPSAFITTMPALLQEFKPHPVKSNYVPPKKTKKTCGPYMTMSM
jgi:hypothetical protein